jgi:hypothetical protein
VNRTRVISFRLPASLAAGVRSQTGEELSLSRAMSWFISAAAQTPELVASLDGCPGDRDGKLDFRLSWNVYNALEAACRRTKLSPSVYLTLRLSITSVKLKQFR